MNYTNGSNLRMDMISDCRQRAIVILRMFPELEGPKYFKALCNIVINDPLLEIHEKTYLIYDLASWKSGPYTEWDNEQQELKRDGKGTYILKHLGDTEKCYNEIEASFTTEQLFSQSQVRCYGLTRSPHTQNFVLVLHKMDSDLRRFLKANSDLSWKIKFKMVRNISNSIRKLHNQDHIHRDLHSGNVLVDKNKFHCVLSDFDIYVNDIIQELKLVPVNRKSTKWNILKGANSEKRFDTEVIIMKKMENLLRDAYINNGIIRELNVHPNDSAIRKILNVLEKFNFIKEIFSKSKRIFAKELSRTSKEIKPSISENTSTLLLLEEDGRISKDITSIPEQDKRISTIGLHSRLSISDHDGGTTTINAPIMEQEESNATDVCPLPSKQKENSIVDDALILRQNECDINLQIKRNSANLTGNIYILLKH
ncbi:17922_t:CDS:2 [Gigaspora margarita]|uniref:17922_t:CDS:1 n=1 Tax=Gigaspora margarita TaxID=4874 RepID=A0ABN7VMG1_GIGMA|nr:17922_t:CDS:2 [Gigaspora margarita]